MMTISYSQAREDHETLWALGPADDMTGAYVDQGDLALLLKSPTKATARECYVRQIVYWFQTGTDTIDFRTPGALDRFLSDRPDIQEIAARYGF